MDLLCVHSVSQIFGRNRSTQSTKFHEALQDALQNTVLAFSDLQVVTGIAILVSGYTQLRLSLVCTFAIGGCSNMDRMSSLEKFLGSGKGLLHISAT